MIVNKDLNRQFYNIIFDEKLKVNILAIKIYN